MDTLPFFEEIYRELYKNLLYYCFKIIKDREDAKDIVEESYIKLWDNKVIEINYENISCKRICTSWLYTTVHNASINYLELAERRRKKAGDIEKSYYSSQIPSEEHIIIERETIRLMQSGINRLPPECKKIFKYLYIDGLTVRNIHEVTGLSISTIKNQKGRGLELLKKRGFDKKILAWGL